MNQYYYSQKYGAYANYGIGEPTMAQKGCVITCLSMVLSYFNDKPYYPEQMLSWGRANGMLDSGGNTNWQKFCEATGNKLRYSLTVNPKDGEKVYGLRQVNFIHSGQLHWVLDHPIIPNKIIDPWDGKVKDYGSYIYTNRNVFYIGKK